MESGFRELEVVLSLAGCLVSALSALAITLRDPRARGNQIATLLVGGAAWWSFCQVLWTVAPDPQTAWIWHHAAGPGWAFIGPLSLHLIAQHTHPPRWMTVATAPAYAIGGVFAALQLFTSRLQGEAYATAFGWCFHTGPDHVWFVGFTFACVIPSVAVAIRRLHDVPSPAQRAQLRLVIASIAAPFFIAGLLSGLLPLLDVPCPRLGSTSFALLGAMIAFSHYRYGFSALAPSTFAREILATLPDGLALLGVEGTILSGNERMASMLGVVPERLAGLPIGPALGVSLSDPAANLRDHECRLRAASGRELAVSISTSRLLDKRGVPIGIVLVVRDLRELEELRHHLVTSGRLAAVGELAAGIAHEINNPIAFVRANLSQLRQHWEELAKRLPAGVGADAAGGAAVDVVAEGRELLLECIDGVERTVRIVQDVKDFARGAPDEGEWIDLNDVLARVLRIAHPQVPCQVRVESRFGDLPRLWGNAAHLQQVFLNLALNGLQAIEGEGCLRLESRAGADAVTITVSDDGKGIPPEDLDRIFDPFFTTKPVGEGTGLGLAISFQIIESHGGQVSVQSRPGAGTTFAVRLPLREGRRAGDEPGGG